MNGKIVLVTGATSGIGLVAARALAAQGATVILHGRDPGKTAAVAATVPGKVETVIADLSSLAQVRKLAAEVKARFPRLDVLLNNAGAINNKRTVTVDGLELTFAVNHLAYFLLTRELLPMLGPGSRIVNVASEASRSAKLDIGDLQSERGYAGWTVYANSKLANILFTFELARRLPPGVTANALHPGAVASNFAQNASWMGVAWKLLAPFLRSEEKGASTSIYLASSPEVAGVTGKYFMDSREKRARRDAYDADLARKLWEASEKLTASAP